MSPEKKIDISKLPELANNLRFDAEGRVNPGEAAGLSMTADNLLDACGFDTTINQQAARVTRYAFEVELDNQKMFARVARLKRGDELSRIVFSKDVNSRSIKTPNLGALYFSDHPGGISLVADNGAKPVIDAPEYLELVEAVLENIDSQHSAHLETERESKLMFREDLIIGLSKVGGVLLTLALAYAHIPFGNEDAKLGPVPLPQPIEGLVDLNNLTDHRAQRFSTPEGARALKIGDQTVELPLLPQYDASRAPNAMYVNTSERSSSLERNESRPGLYRVSFDYTTKRKIEPEEARPKDSNPECVAVYGNYREGESRIFTQDIQLRDRVHATVANAEELHVCLNEGENDEALNGTFYVWQEK